MRQTGEQLDPVYAWLASIVGHAVGGTMWRDMKEALERQLLDTQRRDGHACCFRGSWDPRPRAVLPGGRVTATAASVLTAQVFYRYDRVFGTR
jgi:hypothetical protein